MSGHDDLAEPGWLSIARAHVGKSETLGPNDAPFLRVMWARLSGSWLLGQPWCGGAVAYCMQVSGHAYPAAYYRAKAWLDWGRQIQRPQLGAVVVFGRAGGGHVGFVVGTDERDRLLVLGGNQRNRVSVDPFDRGRVLGYRWPSDAPLLWPPLPVIASGAASSSNEA